MALALKADHFRTRQTKARHDGRACGSGQPLHHVHRDTVPAIFDDGDSSAAQRNDAMCQKQRTSSGTDPRIDLDQEIA
jgi:hypothetical protein